MKEFLKQTLSEAGSPSSKRVAFFVLLGAFLAECVVNLGWHRLLSDTLRDQLYYAMLTCMGAVVGGNVLQTIKDIKTGANSPDQPKP